jgi:hypothetical protein
MRKFTILALFLTAFLSVLAAPSASAAPQAIQASCSGTGCDNKDPAATGCSSGSTTVDSQTTSKGTFELRWSPTCQTNWVRVANYAGGGPHLFLDVCDVDRGVCALFNAPTTAGTHFGNMVYSPGSNCAEGLVDYDSDDTYEVVLTSSTC